MRRSLSIALTAAILGAPLVWAAAPSHLVVMQPADLPQAAREAGQSMVLHRTSDGSTYLYIEQQQEHRIVVLDVTNPAHIQAVSTIAVDLPFVFDFDRDLGDKAVLIRFRDDHSVSLLDLHQPTHPSLAPADLLLQSHVANGPGVADFLRTTGPALHATHAAHDYRVVDSADPVKPRLLATVSQVQQQLSNSLMGTTYLLGSNGLTVVRQLDIEKNERRAETSF
jgi:hypothetical protein